LGRGEDEEAQATDDAHLSSPSSPVLVAGPDRDICQTLSVGGKLAYVVFGDKTTGVYYNWYVSISLIAGVTYNMCRHACNHKLNSFAQASSRKPCFYGYATHEEAETAWAFYIETGIIPHSPVEGGVSATPVPQAQPVTPKRNRRRCLNVQGSAVSAANASSHLTSNSPMPDSLDFNRVASSPGGRTVLPPLYAELPPLSQPRILTVARRAEEALFFIVTVGYNPGVYTARRVILISSLNPRNCVSSLVTSLSVQLVL
jgi:hypothetical protein